MMNNFQKFKVLIWKNYKRVVGRHPYLTAIVLAVPIFLAFLLVVLRFQKPQSHPELFYKSYCPIKDKEWCSFNQIYEDDPHKNYDPNTPELVPEINFEKMSVAYAPSGNKKIDDAMNGMKKWFKLGVLPFKTRHELEQHFSDPEKNSTFGGVVFHPVGIENMQEIPKEMQVNIRLPSELRGYPINKSADFHWHTHELHLTEAYQGPRVHGLPVGSYTRQGFIALQMMVTKVLIDASVPQASPETLHSKFPEFRMRRFPSAAWLEETRLLQSHLIVTSTIAFGFLLIYMWIVHTLVREKEKKLRTIQWIMGIPTWLRLLTWFIVWYTLFMAMAIPISLIISAPWFPVQDYQEGYDVSIYVTILSATSPLVVVVFFTLYATAIVTSCFTLATFFSKTNRATLFAMLVFVLTILPYMILVDRADVDTVADTKAVLLCLFINTAMGLGLRIMLQWEENGEGAQFHNLWQRPTGGQGLNLGLILIMLAVDFVIYFLLATYINLTFPPKEEALQALPWDFFMKQKYMCPCMKQEKLNFHRLTLIKDEYVEPDPPGFPVGVQFIHVWNIHSENIVALKDFSIRMYEGQIVTFLGEHSSEKNTIIGLLAGVFKPSAGTVLERGLDVHDNTLKVQQNLGYCPPTNILFDHLTIEEHFYFYSKIKGIHVHTTDLDDDTEYFIETLKLQKDRKVRASRLSVGTKRKLCVALAFCGRSRVVLLDMPTKGLDLVGRRDMWNFIRNVITGRTVIVTTVFIDEAEMLSDRIAIMAEGELQCYGSISFLKKKFGAGCYLTVFFGDDDHMDVVNRLLHGYIPEIKESDKDQKKKKHRRYLLPNERMSIIPQILSDLDANRKALSIKSYRISMNTLDDIYLRISSMQHRPVKYTKTTTKRRPTFAERYNRPLKIYKGVSLVFAHILAILVKRIILFSRKLGQFSLVLIVLGLLLWLAMSGIKSLKRLLILPYLPLSFAAYSSSEIIIEDTPKKVITDINPDIHHLYELALEKVAALYEYGRHHIGSTIMSEYAIRQRREAGQLFNEKIVMGLSFHSPQTNQAPRVVMWYNDHPLHAEGVAASFGLQMIYQLNTQNFITFVNAPLPFTFEAMNFNRHTSTLKSMYITCFFMLAICIVGAYPVIFYVLENTTKSLLLQKLFGIKIWVFLIVSFLFDFVIYLFMLMVIILLLVAFGKEQFATSEDMYVIFSLLVAYGFAIIPLIYLSSKMYRGPANGYIRTVASSYIVGSALLLIGLLFRLMDLPTLERTQRILLIIPFYALGDALQRYQQLSGWNETCTEIINHCTKMRTIEHCYQHYCENKDYLGFKCCAEGINLFALKSGYLGENLLYLACFGTVMMLLTFFVEYNYWRSLLSILVRTLQKTKPIHETDEGADVIAERTKVSRYPQSGRGEYYLVLQEVAKNYGNVRSLNGISIGIRKGECLGLLGHDGSGKSTLFRLLTGDISAPVGAIYIAGRKMTDRRHRKMNSIIGYCPQNNGLFGSLTVRQSMMMYCLIRGVALEDCRLLTEKIAVDFDFFQQLNLQVKQLSESNCKKLRCAMAVIGDPKILFLEKPTLGMDARSREKTWKYLRQARDAGATIIIFPHSMEECEALCTRMAIMVRGNLNCIGSVEDLKNRFSKGFTVTIRLWPVVDQIEENRRKEEIETFFHETFEKTLLIEKKSLSLTLFTESEHMTCKSLFIKIENAREQFHIKDYTIGQTSFDEVFLYFTRRIGI